MLYHFKQSTPCAQLLIMTVSTEIVIGFVMPVNGTNSILAAGQTATTVSEHFVHALRDHDYVVAAMLGMYWLWSSAMNESAESFFFILKISISGNVFWNYFCNSDPPTLGCQWKALDELYNSSISI